MNPVTHHPDVLIGSSIPPGLEQLDVHCKLKLGSIVLTAFPRSVDEALELAKTCRARGIYLCFSEICFRGSDVPGKPWGGEVAREAFFSRADLERIASAAGEYYFGRYAIGEIGGIVYWPKGYFTPPRRLSYQALPASATQQEARDHYVAYCRRLLARDRAEYGSDPLINVESSLLLKYQAEAGLDKLCLEVMPGDPLLLHAAIRGTARAADLPWGVHIAMGWYGGVTVDRLFEERWRAALGWSFISGAGFIFPESGHYGYNNPLRDMALDFHSEPMKRMRRTLRDYVQFAGVHRRPAGGPRVRLGILHGNLDGAPGLWNRYAWGQTHAPEWLEGPAERGWNLVNTLFQRLPWTTTQVQGDTDWSGNPPLGQVDLVPMEADAGTFSRYGCLICLAWNTMTPEIYANLRDYVRGGGRLILFLPQLGTQSGRAEPVEVIHDGDLADLFGVRISGKGATDVQGIRYLQQPSLPGYSLPVYKEFQDPVFLGNLTPATVELRGARVLAGLARRFTDSADMVRKEPFLVENRLGDGHAMLVLSWNWPADDALTPFTADLLRTVVAGEQGDIRVTGSDRVRYAVYEAGSGSWGGSFRVLYLLNSDPDSDACVRLGIGSALSPQLRLPCGALLPLYVLGNLVLVPGDKLTDLASWRQLDDGSISTHMYTVHDQDMAVWTAAARTEVQINDAAGHTRPDAWVSIQVLRRPDPARLAVFDPDYLNEPPVEYQDAALPY